MTGYVRRTLTFRNDKGEIEQLSDLTLLSAADPIIVLGEPGMGKTWLLRWISDAPGWTFRSAAAFVNHPDPSQLVPEGAKLVIDGLDELSAAQESDPVYRVLGQLIKAGCPPFILSCRAADWRGASARQDISEEYGASPREMTLQPFTREGAVEFLDASLGPERSEEVIAYLEKKGIPDLYGNPLTLNLFAEVAANNGPLPETRAGLMLRAAEIMWNERNDRHDKTPLSNLDQSAALAAAGVACAAFILTGSEAISLKPSGIAPRAVRAAELAPLPGGERTRTLIGSRLFSVIPNASDQYKPIHRSVAEFLGARWLASSVKDEQARNRAIAMMTIDSGVPASLRGIHAWLAQDDRFAPYVIETDPYGVLRYGDADGLSVAQGRLLLKALVDLQASKPYFRAEDWGQHSAKGLTHPELLGDIRSILLDKDTSFHLRTLLLGAIKGSGLAASLADDLYHIMLQDDGREFNYAERHDAGQAIIAVGRNDIDWPALMGQLVKMGGEDSSRLALDMMDDLGFESFTPQLITRAMLAHLGLLEDVDAEETDHSSYGTLYVAARKIPNSLIAPVLDELAEHFPPSGADHHRARAELSDLVNRLVDRQISTGEPEPLRLLKWLRIVPGRHGYSREDQKRIFDYLQSNEAVRRAIQHQAVFVERDHERLWSRMWRLADVNPALAFSADDVIYFLGLHIAAGDRSDEGVELWRELASFGQRTDGRSEDIIVAARPFAQGHPELESHLEEIAKPRPKADWEIKNEKRHEQEEARKAMVWAQHRKDFGEHEAEMRAGELRWIFGPSQAYLALFTDSDRDLPPPQRIGQWLGEDLQAAAIAGFEAVLTRSDLPALQQIADSYAQSRRWNYVHPMIAGVVERLRTGRGLDGVPVDVLIAVRIALHNDHIGDRINHDLIVPLLDEELRRDPAVHERLARLLIEPSLRKRQTHVMGLYSFVRAPADRALAIELSAEWLRRYSKMPTEVEIEFIDVLADAGRYDVLQEVGRKRAKRGFANDQQRRNWLAAGLLADFEKASGAFGTIAPEERNLLWHLRHRLRGDRTAERPMPAIGAAALAWIVRQFRGLWPNVRRPTGVTSGDTNEWDATAFIHLLINRLESDPSSEAAQALEALSMDSEDSYTSDLRYAVERQRAVRREINFPGVTLDRLKDVVESRPPATSDDLLAILRFALGRLQKELRGSDTDTVGKYWGDSGQPRNEDRCTDLLIEDIMRLLPPYGIGRVPQADMPKGKIADILFTIGDAALPVECKGQWHPKLWAAAGNQLDAFYLSDWRAQDRGIYLVYWFGPDVAPNFKLKAPPGGAARPDTPGALRQQLIESLPAVRRGSIVVEVLDLTR